MTLFLRSQIDLSRAFAYYQDALVELSIYPALRAGQQLQVADFTLAFWYLSMPELERTTFSSKTLEQSQCARPEALQLIAENIDHVAAFSPLAPELACLAELPKALSAATADAELPFFLRTHPSFCVYDTLPCEDPNPQPTPGMLSLYFSTCGELALRFPDALSCQQAYHYLLSHGQLQPKPLGLWHRQRLGLPPYPPFRKNTLGQTPWLKEQDTCTIYFPTYPSSSAGLVCDFCCPNLMQNFLCLFSDLTVTKSFGYAAQFFRTPTLYRTPENITVFSTDHTPYQTLYFSSASLSRILTCAYAVPENKPHPVASPISHQARII